MAVELQSLAVPLNLVCEGYRTCALAATARGKGRFSRLSSEVDTRVAASASSRLFNEAGRLDLLDRCFDGFDAAVGVEDLEALGGEVAEGGVAVFGVVLGGVGGVVAEFGGEGSEEEFALDYCGAGEGVVGVG